jgi:hypothetical protein
MSTRLEKMIASVRTSASTFVERLRGERAAHWLTADRLQLYSVGALICFTLFVSIYLVRAIWMSHEYMTPLAVDFVPFWSASHLALHGHAVDAYNFEVLHKVESAALARPAGILLWLYPPSFLLVVYPFALLPWQIAATLFLGVTYLMFIKAMHAIVGRKETMMVAAAFPGAMLGALAGQNGMLTASLVAFGLVLLPRRPLLAGVCFGVLCMKPQLAVLLPFALLCARSWRALGALAFTALAMLGIAVALFGVETLSAFLHSMGTVAQYVESSRAAMHRIPSAYSFVKMMHGPTMLANAAQAVSVASAAAAVWYAWSRAASHALRAATLVSASLMVSPYLYDYDLAWLGVFIAWYVKHAMEHGWRPWQREWMIVLWLMPFAGIFIVGKLHFQFMPLIIAMTLAMVVRRIATERRALGRAQVPALNPGIGAHAVGAQS